MASILESVCVVASVVSDSATAWTAARQASLSITNSWSLIILLSIELVMPSNHLILHCPLLLLPLIFPSIRVFPNESVLHIISGVVSTELGLSMETQTNRVEEKL